MKKIKEIVIFCGILSIAVILAVDKRYSVAVTDGISLWFSGVLPVLFPYFFITAMLSSMKVTAKIAIKLNPLTTRLFRTGGVTGYALLMSVISGYPVGAKLVSDLKSGGLISDTEAVRASAFCSTASPTFLIAGVGSITFGNIKLGVLLCVTNLISTFLTGIVFSFYKRKDKPLPAKAIDIKTADNILYDGVYSAVISSLTVGGIITLFFTLTEILLSIGVLSPFITLIQSLTGSKAVGEGAMLGLFECTKGLKALANGEIGALTLPVASSICGFGGLSVIAQSTAYLKRAKIKTTAFVLAKLLTAVISFGIGLLFTLFL